MMGEWQPSPTHLEFSTVTGYFLQDEETTDPDSFDYVSTNFGIINRSYDTDAEFDTDHEKTQWQRFEHKINQLNKESDSKTSYKVLILGRHGQGYHNAAERFYGTEAWDCYWSLQDGDANGTWVDAHLTPLGEDQAKTAHNTWKTQIENNIPTPQSYYVSPLNRCLATAAITFRGTNMSLTEPFQPTIKESLTNGTKLLRETLGIHTCDRRSSKSDIVAEYPLYRFEDNFAESDPLWDAELRESDSARDARLRELLKDIWTNDENTFLSLTAHSGAITSILNVVGHRRFQLATGGVIPVIVRGSLVDGEEPVRKIEPPTRKPDCGGKDYSMGM